MTFPPNCNSHEERLAFALRVYWLLLRHHNEQRAATITRKVRALAPPIDIDDPAQVAEFKRWQRESYKPREKRCHEALNALSEDVSEDVYQRLLAQQRTDTTWDNSIDLDAL